MLTAFGFTIAGSQNWAGESTDKAAKTTNTGATVRHTDVAGAESLLASGKFVVLDIRTPEEYAAGHLKGAKLVDFKASDFKVKLAELDRKQPYLLHCASGRRSTAALETFKALGFKEVVHLDGGFNAWKAAGKPVAR